MGDLVHRRNHQQTNGSLSAALLSRILGSRLWCLRGWPQSGDSGRIKEEYLTLFGD